MGKIASCNLIACVAVAALQASFDCVLLSVHKGLRRLSNGGCPHSCILQCAVGQGEPQECIGKEGGSLPFSNCLPQRHLQATVGHCEPLCQPPPIVVVTTPATPLPPFLFYSMVGEPSSQDWRYGGGGEGAWPETTSALQFNIGL